MGLACPLPDWLHYVYVCSMAIDVDEYQPASSAVTKMKKWLPDLNLLDVDRQVLLDPVGWLTDSIMNASQQLLRNAFPNLNSLQDVGIGNVMCFEIQMGKFVQILYSNSHWVTVSCDGGDPIVEVFDSSYSVARDIVKAQIAALFFTQHSSIQVRSMDVQKQVH